jgi:hypothetical protein
MAEARAESRVAVAATAGPAWGIDEAFVGRLLAAAPDALDGDVLRRMPGRVTLRLAAPGGRPLVVKRTEGPAERDGLARWLRRFRLGAGSETSACPARREFEALATLGALGLQVPAPLAWGRRVELERSVGIVVMALVPHAESLRQRLARVPADAARFAPELAALVARLHGAGWYHRDLYLEHVVVEASTERLVLLDLARARGERAPRRRWFVKDLGALASTPGVDEAARCRFFELYCDLRGIPPSARGAWVRAILARARRIARHVPRHADPETREGGL